MHHRRVRSSHLAGSCSLVLLLACGSSEPDEGLRARLERERREEVEREVERRLADERTKLHAEEEVRKRSGIVIDLPKGVATDIDVTQASLVIQVPVSGDVVVAGTVVPADELETVFRAAYARDKRTQVVLQADRGVPHGKVVGIMAQAKAAGLTRLAIGTSP
jgi:biopolymer transport protein ExbD